MNNEAFYLLFIMIYKVSINTNWSNNLFAQTVSQHKWI